MPDKKMIECELLYLCDPEKNTECSKTGCYHNPNAECEKKDGCKATSNKEYAKLTESGKPIVNTLICDLGTFSDFRE